MEVGQKARCETGHWPHGVEEDVVAEVDHGMLLRPVGYRFARHGWSRDPPSCATLDVFSEKGCKILNPKIGDPDMPQRDRCRVGSVGADGTPHT